MSKIRFEHADNAPGCIGKIVEVRKRQKGDGPRDELLIQTDWEWPSVASNFGWSIDFVQCCRKCGRPLSFVIDGIFETEAIVQCEECRRKKGNGFCYHSGTDGTVDCKDCGVTASQFISSAGEFLNDNDGVEAYDPGYFLYE